VPEETLQAAAISMAPLGPESSSEPKTEAMTASPPNGGSPYLGGASGSRQPAPLGNEFKPTWSANPLGVAPQMTVDDSGSLGRTPLFRRLQQAD
jgi:hypothetical protein